MSQLKRSEGVCVSREKVSEVLRMLGFKPALKSEDRPGHPESGQACYKASVHNDNAIHALRVSEEMRYRNDQQLMRTCSCQPIVLITS